MKNESKRSKHVIEAHFRRAGVHDDQLDKIDPQRIRRRTKEEIEDALDEAEEIKRDDEEWNDWDYERESDILENEYTQWERYVDG